VFAKLIDDKGTMQIKTFNDDHLIVDQPITTALEMEVQILEMLPEIQR